MVDLVYCLTSLLFFDIMLFYILLYYYTYQNLSIICCLPYGDLYLSFGFSVSHSTVTEVFCRDFFVILLAIELPIKSPVVSTGFLIALFEVVLSVLPADCLA